MLGLLKGRNRARHQPGVRWLSVMSAVRFGVVHACLCAVGAVVLGVEEVGWVWLLRWCEGLGGRYCVMGTAVRETATILTCVQFGREMMRMRGRMRRRMGPGVGGWGMISRR